MKMKTKASLLSSDFDPPSLPNDLIVEILLRLPMRSLLRFKCVCKSWLSLISNPQFPKSHFDVAVATTYRLLLNFSDDSKVNSIDIERPLCDDSKDVVINLPLPPPPPKRRCMVRIVGSCRGFILLKSVYSNHGDFVIWNPSTGQHKRINNAVMGANVFGIGYDSSTDDYVVVVTPLPTRVHYFSLRTNSWSCTEGIVPYPFKSNCGMFLNGALHWLYQSYDNLGGVIIAFDVMKRRLSDIPLSHDLVIALKSHMYHLRVMGGCLCLCCFVGSSVAMLEIWTMKEYKVLSSWTKSFVLSRDYHPDPYYFSPICFTTNGEILGSNDYKTLVKLDDKGNLLEHRAHGERMGGGYGLAQCAMYREFAIILRGI